MAMGGENCNIQCLSTFLSSELTNIVISKTKQTKIETKRIFYALPCLALMQYQKVLFRSVLPLGDWVWGGSFWTTVNTQNNSQYTEQQLNRTTVYKQNNGYREQQSIHRTTVKQNILVKKQYNGYREQQSINRTTVNTQNNS